MKKDDILFEIIVTQEMIDEVNERLKKEKRS